MDTVAEILSEECARRGAGWSSHGTRMAVRKHVLAGDPYSGSPSVWDLIEVGVREEVRPAGGWHVSAHRWTTAADQDSPGFVTLAHESDPRWSVVHAFDHADELFAGYVAAAEAGTLAEVPARTADDVSGAEA